MAEKSYATGTVKFWIDDNSQFIRFIGIIEEVESVKGEYSFELTGKNTASEYYFEGNGEDYFARNLENYGDILLAILNNPNLITCGKDYKKFLESHSWSIKFTFFDIGKAKNFLVTDCIMLEHVVTYPVKDVFIDIKNPINATKKIFNCNFYGLYLAYADINERLGVRYANVDKPSFEGFKLYLQNYKSSDEIKKWCTHNFVYMLSKTIEELKRKKVSFIKGYVLELVNFAIDMGYTNMTKEEIYKKLEVA